MSALMDEPAEPRPGEGLDVAALAGWLRASAPERRGAIEVAQFHGGYSNLTYLVTVGGREMVLRRAPDAAEGRGARDVMREYDVLARLCEVYPLAPRPICRCDDRSVIGAPFYLMERRRGLVLRRQLPAGLALGVTEARRLSEVFIDTLAHLHSIDGEAAGLTRLTASEGYAGRQVREWILRYKRSAVDSQVDMADVARWLEAELPPDGAAAMIHNDYKYDNLMFDPGDLTRVVAVLDWEMGSVGDPRMDLGTALAYWQERDDPGHRLLAVGPTYLPGSLTRRQLVERYEQRTGRQVARAVYYYVFGLFKVAVIAQRLHERYLRGETRNPRLAGLGRHVTLLSRAAAEAAGSGRC
ncbi:phosphotransferase family protein [Sorangium sp. So ce388]|uniref:phosphotransferase family protein n=1 Tax=Sorangium sp. So ce388 TaxID=3133309 RepID=UPI003F5C19C0